MLDQLATQLSIVATHWQTLYKHGTRTPRSDLPPPQTSRDPQPRFPIRRIRTATTDPETLDFGGPTASKTYMRSGICANRSRKMLATAPLKRSRSAATTRLGETRKCRRAALVDVSCLFRAELVGRIQRQIEWWRWWWWVGVWNSRRAGTSSSKIEWICATAAAALLTYDADRRRFSARMRRTSDTGGTSCSLYYRVRIVWRWVASTQRAR